MTRPVFTTVFLPTWLAVRANWPVDQCPDAHAHPAHKWAPDPGPGGAGPCACRGPDSVRG